MKEKKQQTNSENEKINEHVAILAYGSLIWDPGVDIKQHNITVVDCITPFNVEYAQRSDETRKGAPTLTNFEGLKGKVYHEFWSQYIEASLPLKIIDTLISQKWGNGEMDTATSSFLFYTVCLQSQSAISKAYVIQPEKINYELANKILYQELPEWKAKLARNALTAIQAIGQAYKEQPSRLKEANKAKTFEEFIEKCKG